MKRLDVIDGLRGYFLVFMLINHLVFDGGYWLVEINHRQLAFVEDAQGFVFLSGLLIGMVYTRKMQRDGFWDGGTAIWRRAGDLYLYSLGVLAVVLTAAVLAPHAGDAWENWIGDLSWSNPGRVLAAAALVFQPTYMDILPQYIFYMLAAPPLIWICLKGRWEFVLIGSGLLWLSAQLGVHRPVTDALNVWLAGDTDAGLRANFNLFGWQIVFFSALVFGVLTAAGTIDWKRIFRPDDNLLPVGALLVCLFFLPFRIALSKDLMPESIFASFHVFESRPDFGLVYLLNFAGAAVLLAWLLIAGPDHEARWVRRVSEGLARLFSVSFLRLIGRHSLQVYAWHVIIVYAVRLIDVGTPRFDQPTKLAIAVACIALLALPALWRERSLDTRQPA